MSIALAEWDARIRAIVGLSMLEHPARLRDGIRDAAAALAIDEDELFARIDGRQPIAIAALARTLTVGETYFFRDVRQFDLLRSELLPAALERAGDRPVRIVSAGCSSGEEAYTAAIVACELLGNDAARRVHVTAFDLNEASLERARRATYRPWSLRGVPLAIRQRWFEPHEDGLRVVEQARRLVTFERRNLVSPAEALPPLTFDVVFCRNVLIYLDAPAIQHVLSMLSASLVPEGVLIVAPAETGLFGPAGIGIVDRDGISLHSPSIPPPPPRIDPPNAAQSPIAAVTSSGERTPRARRRPRPEPAAPSSSAPPPSSSSAFDATAFVERGFVVLERDAAAAWADARSALLLDRTLAPAWVLAASAAVAQNDATEARRALRHARRYLVNAEPNAPLPGGGGATAAELGAYCTRIERALKKVER